MVDHRFLSCFLIFVPLVQSQQFICYFTPTSYFASSAVPSNLCTHVIYAFAQFKDGGIGFRSTTEQTMVINMVSRLKRENPYLKVSLSIQKGFPTVVDSLIATKKFAFKAVRFLRKYSFDGIDFDWEFPSTAEKETFARFIKIFRKNVDIDAKLKKPALLISMALPNNVNIISSRYDLTVLNKNIDFATVMAYDFHVFNAKVDSKTGLNSPLYPVAGESKYYSVSGLMEYYLSSGLLPSKTIVGIPTYGRSYKLANPRNSGLHAQAVGRGDPSPYRKLRGVYTYTDVCFSIKHSAKTTTDAISHGKYLVKGDNWVAYDDTDTVREKTKWAMGRGFGGVGIWAVDLDDDTGVCGIKLPLITAIKDTLFGSGLLEYYLSSGILPPKTVVGIPTYGRSYKLANPRNSGLHALAVGRGPYGGVFTYTDVCSAIKDGAVVTPDPKSQGKYLVYDDNWVTFDDEITTQWAIDHGIAGVGIWAFHLDDITCNCGSYLHDHDQKQIERNNLLSNITAVIKQKKNKMDFILNSI